MERQPVKRDIRGNFTGGQEDLEDFFKELQRYAESKSWTLTFKTVKPFGEFGPLKKLTFGFTSGNE